MKMGLGSGGWGGGKKRIWSIGHLVIWSFDCSI
jgi:hypothetical protein